jgi:CheY-like chemotaxis protein
LNKTKSVKILLVEDDALFRGLINKALEKEGYQITIAEDGEQAHNKICSGIFDLVITDLFMPNKEGFEVIQEIRKTNSHIKIIAISSNALVGHSSFLKMALAFGANDSLQKPFSPEQLIEKINHVMNK